MIRIRTSSSPNRPGEDGQVLVMATAILGALAIFALFYLSVQRAYNLANFLDETAELVAQAAARPEGDTIVDGSLTIDPAEARKAGKAALEFSLEAIPGEVDQSEIDALKLQLNTDDGLKVYNPGDVSADCTEIGASSPDCLFPAVRVQLRLNHRLFGINFTIGTDGIATLGDDPRFNDSLPNPFITPEPTPAISPIIVTPSS